MHRSTSLLPHTVHKQKGSKILIREVVIHGRLKLRSVVYYIAIYDKMTLE